MEQEALGKVIGLLFMSRSYTHMCHLKTGSFAKHKALNGFYDSVVELADELAEAAQGKFGKLDIPYMDMKGDVNDPIAGLSAQLVMLENLGKKCSDRALQNIFDEIIALFYSTLYLMKELD